MNAIFAATLVVLSVGLTQSQDENGCFNTCQEANCPPAEYCARDDLGCVMCLGPWDTFPNIIFKRGEKIMIEDKRQEVLIMCPMVLCAVYCPDGMEVDENGCSTCICKTQVPTIA